MGIRISATRNPNSTAEFRHGFEPHKIRLANTAKCQNGGATHAPCDLVVSVGSRVNKVLINVLLDYK